MKKLSKRILSVLLSALLVMTSVPLFAIDAFAADYSSLDAAMAAYETKMDGNFYTNMTAAYQAYMAADVVKKNENATQADINSAASALTTATDNMDNFSGHAAVGPIHYGTAEEQPSWERYANILWADGTGDTAYDENQGGKAETSTVGIVYGAYFYFYYPTNSVLMYDGRNTPYLPIMMGVIDKDSNYNLHPCYVRTNSSDFALDDYWYGYDDNFVWSATTTSRIGYSVASEIGMGDAVEIDNTSTIRSFFNYMRCTVNPGNNTMVTVNGIEWREQHNMNVLGQTSHTGEDKILNMTIPVRIINYKKLLDKLGQVGGMYGRLIDDISDYKEDGGMLPLLQAIDYAATDPNSFFTNGNGYQACAAWIDAAIDGLDAVQTPQMDASALASVEGAADALEAFETKMNEGMWKNVLPVYQKYVYLKAVVDAEEYGDRTYSTEDIAAATQDLVTAMANMQSYTKYVATGKVTMAADSSPAATYNQGIVQNVTTRGWQVNSSNNNNIWFSMPQTVIALYNGETDIQIPVMMDWHNSRGLFGASMRMYDCYPTDNASGSVNDNADYGFNNMWMCTNQNADNNAGTGNALGLMQWAANRTPTNDSSMGDYGGYNKATSKTNGSNNQQSGQQKANNGGDVFVYENFLQYKGGDSGFTNGLKTSNIGFHYVMRNASGNTSNNPVEASTTNTITVYTIDYKTPYNQFAAAWSNIMTQLASGNYDEGGLATQIGKLDAFTSIDISAATDGTSAGTVAQALATAGSNLTSGLEGTVNSQYYQDLRDKLEWYPSAEKYVAGMADPTLWTAESWQDLIDAIDDARAIFTALPTNNPYYYITASAAHNAEQAIQTAYDNLVEAGVLIDPALEAYVELISLLDDYTYLASDLRTAGNMVTGLNTSCYNAGPFGTKVPATPENIAAIQNETAVFTAAAQALTEQTFDKDTYESYIEAARRGVNDPDAYNITQLTQDIETLENAAFETVNFPFYGDVIGLKANAQSAVNSAWAAVQTDLNTLMNYTVVVKDTDGNTLTNVGEGTYAYGTEVTINAGTANYKYDYVSNTSNTNAGHKTKDVGTVDSLTFTVQGNTTVTVGAPTANKPVTVTYKVSMAPLADGEAAATFTYRTDYAAAGTTITAADFTAPSYAFYAYNGFTQETAANGDITVTMNYIVAGNAPQYEIYNGDEDYETGVGTYYYLNELVSVTMEDAEAIATTATKADNDYFYEDMWDPDTYELIDNVVPVAEIVAYGDTYTFRAKENIYLANIPSLEDYAPAIKRQLNEAGVASPVYVKTTDPVITNGSSIVTYSSFAIPDDYEPVEAGILIQYNKSGDDLLDRPLSFNNAGEANDIGEGAGKDRIRRLKASEIHTDEDNRFTYTPKLNCSHAKAKYVAYVNYKDDEGELHTVFSDVKTVTIG